MKTEKEIREFIKKIEADYRHVMEGGMATVFENAPRALMQLCATSELGILYWVLGEKRPRYEFEKKVTEK